MTTRELVDKFPEIPCDLERESILARFAETFDALLHLARRPGGGPMRTGDRYYRKLIGPMSDYKYGLCTRARLLLQLRELLDLHASDPSAFAARLRESGPLLRPVRTSVPLRKLRS